MSTQGLEAHEEVGRQEVMARRIPSRGPSVGQVTPSSSIQGRSQKANLLLRGVVPSATMSQEGCIQAGTFIEIKGTPGVPC